MRSYSSSVRLAASLLFLPSLNAGAAETLPARNLLVNGGFEQGGRGWNIGTPGAMLVPNQRGKCLRLQPARDGKPHDVVSAPFRVTPSARYRLSSAIKGPQGTQQSFKVAVQWLDSRSHHLGYANDWNGLIKGKDWQPHGRDLTAPANAARARVILGIKPTGIILFDDISFQLIPPAFAIRALGVDTPVASATAPVELRCAISNTGGEPVTGLAGTLGHANESHEVGIDRLGVGEERTLRVKLDPARLTPGAVELTATFRAANAWTQHVADTMLVLPTNAVPVAELKSGPVTLRFITAHRLVNAVEVVRGGKLLGRMRGFGTLRRRGGGFQPLLMPLKVGERECTGKARLADCTITMNIAAGKDGWFTLTGELVTRSEMDLVHWSLLDLFAAFPGTGPEKDSAIFCGLDYLTKTEVSSCTNSVACDLAERYVPHPNCVTVPLMAVAHDGVALGLAWNPLNEWTRGHDRPAAIFAAPDRFHLSDGHFMSLAAPGVSASAGNNAPAVITPVHLRPGDRLMLRAHLFVLPVQRDVSEVLLAWYSQEGVPTRPAIERNSQERWRQAIYDSMAAWNREVKGWRLEAHRDARFNPTIALQLLIYGIWHNDAVATEALGQCAQAISRQISQRGPGGIGLDLALHVGHVRENLGQLDESTASRWLKSQQNDGSWQWHPDSSRVSGLGKSGDTASGVCLKPALHLLEFAQLTGNADVLNAALKGIQYVDKNFTRPAGGEMWEVPLHAPNLRAATLGVQAGVLAYRVTGERRYLDMARYWATTGLPFVYAWEAADRPGMRYATTSVFGASFYTCPWFGRPVQWVGIEYARALEHLSQLDQSFAWETIAEGIVLSAFQQQELARSPEIGNPWPGAIPDSYDLVQGVVQGAWIGPHLLTPVLEQWNGIAAIETALIGAPRTQLCIKSAAAIVESDLTGGSLRAKVRYPAGRTAHTVILPATRPQALFVDSLCVAESSDLETAQSGWSYVPQHRAIIMKYAGGEIRLVEIRGVGFAPTRCRSTVGPDPRI